MVVSLPLSVFLFFTVATAERSVPISNYMLYKSASARFSKGHLTEAQANARATGAGGSASSEPPNTAPGAQGGGGTPSTRSPPALGWQALEMLDSILRTQRTTPPKWDPAAESEANNEQNSSIDRGLLTPGFLPMPSCKVETLLPGRIRIRQATMVDVTEMQRINLVCLPENYQMKYYFYHILSWPTLAHVAEADCGGVMRVVGYVLGKMDSDSYEARPPNAGNRGHVTSIAVMRTHRRMKVGQRLMECALRFMVEEYQVETLFFACLPACICGAGPTETGTLRQSIREVRVSTEHSHSNRGTRPPHLPVRSHAPFCNIPM